MTVRSSHAENFEPVGQYASRRRSQIRYGPAHFVKGKERRKVEAPESRGVTPSVSDRRSCTSAGDVNVPAM